MRVLTNDHLFDASFFGKRDCVDGVSECIILGIPVDVGTGLFRVVQECNEGDDVVEGRRKLLINKK